MPSVTQTEGTEVLTLKEASRYLKLSADALGELARQKKIPAFKLGRRWRFRKSTLDRWVERQEQWGKDGSAAMRNPRTLIER